jgi:hypothetical protein
MIIGIKKFDEKQNFTLWQGLVHDVLVLQGLDDALSNTKPMKMKDDKLKTLCGKTLSTIRFCLSNEIKTPFMAETYPK